MSPEQKLEKLKTRLRSEIQSGNLDYQEAVSRIAREEQLSQRAEEALLATIECVGAFGGGFPQLLAALRESVTT